MKTILDVLKITLCVTFMLIQACYLAVIGFGGTIILLAFGEISGWECFFITFPVIPMLVCQKYLFPIYEKILKA